MIGRKTVEEIKWNGNDEIMARLGGFIVKNEIKFRAII